MRIKTLAELDLENRSVLLRVDFNVPLEKGRVADDTRVRAALPTIRAILERARRVVVMSHLGRPKGKVAAGLSLRPVAGVLEDHLSVPVLIAEPLAGGEAPASAGRAAPLVLLENLRFHPEEEADDPGFAERLAVWGDVYVNDAFGAAHRAHASTHAVASFFEERGMGLLMQREVEALGALLGRPAAPFVVVLGGAKISGKVELVESLLDRAQTILIGGAMAFTFLRALGTATGRSLVEEDRVDLAGRLLAMARERTVDILLPADAVLSRDAGRPEGMRTAPIGGIAADEMGVDIGPATRALFGEKIRAARTVFWNGPMGIFEVEPFAQGTLDVARAVAAVTVAGASSVVGGGDSVAALQRLGLAEAMTHVSTGGGASLEFLGGRELPGLAALRTA